MKKTRAPRQNTAVASVPVDQALDQARRDLIDTLSVIRPIPVNVPEQEVRDIDVSWLGDVVAGSLDDPRQTVVDPMGRGWVRSLRPRQTVNA